MSGIVGLVNLDGAPVDRELLEEMADFMACRAPDARGIWVDGQVGLGHALLRTTSGSLPERQPCTLAGQVWITADARVDGQAELARELEGKGDGDLRGATDAELILKAYEAWGEDCVGHLLGDFAFAIWDGPRHRLFCARDHFGVKPFYYARVGGSLVFGNTLNALRVHPDVSDRLNDLAIADVLLFGRNREPTTTTRADIRRLPGAHSLSWSGGALRVNRYWTLSLDREIRYRRPDDYVERFRELLKTAVGDRLRGSRVAVMMSGGLDSTTVAATARDLGGRFELRAHTIVYDRLIPDEERYYSGLVAEALGIPVHYLVADDYALYERADQLRQPEPPVQPLSALTADFSRQVAAHGRVALTGIDADCLLRESPKPYFRTLFTRRRFGSLLAAMLGHVVSQRQPPPIGLRTGIKRWLGKGWQGPAFPRWLNPAFSGRLDLPARWEQLKPRPATGHPVRPRAFYTLASPDSPLAFEGFDPGVTLLPLEVRHPFLDLRLVSYLVSIPPVPWCVDKWLVRLAMRGVLPAAVLRRPKSPVARDPVGELLRHQDAEWVNRFEPAPELLEYVETRAIPRIAGEEAGDDVHVNLGPLGLNYWLRYSTAMTERVGGGR